MVAEETDVRAIYWKHLTTAERRQLGNVSNVDSAAGGGARDLRCRPHEAFKAVFGGHELGRDARSTVNETIVHYVDSGGQDRSYTLQYSVNDPDAARSNETRIRRAGDCPALLPAAISEPPDAHAGPSPREDYGGTVAADFILIAERLADGQVRLRLVRGGELHLEHSQIELAVRSGRQGGREFEPGLVPSRQIQLPPEIEDALDAVAEAAGKPKASPFPRLPAEVKSAIENLAMSRAIEHYKAAGWHEVEDVSARHLGFDLLCTQPGQEMHVEVKGTQTTGIRVPLTPNEVAHARLADNVALFVLANITVALSDGPPIASGGDAIVLEPWEIDSGELRPVGYMYTLPE